MATTTTAYGTYAHGAPYWTGEGWRRDDAWTPRGESRPTATDSALATGREDDSPLYCGAYDPACASCWLNATHTTARHNAAIAAKGAA